jgi:hypothetical protein
MINFHNIDCMAFMADVSDKYYSIALVDPPYGLGNKLIDGGTWRGLTLIFAKSTVNISRQGNFDLKIINDN